MTSENQVHFENINQQISKELQKARKSIYVAVAWLNDLNLISVLQSKVQQGVSVQVIISAHKFNDTIRLYDISKNGGEVYLVGGEDIMDYGFMHNKFCVIDYKTVITGSFNWTKNASSNEENVVIVRDDKVAFDYVQQCHKLIRRGEVLDFDHSNDIKITFTALKTYIEKGESVKLEWKAQNASKVAIENIGSDLDLEGFHSVKVHQDTIFRITATEGSNTKVKDVQIKVVRHPEIEFFISTNSIVRGMQTATLKWKSKNAEKVEIDNQIGEVGLEGEKQVMPDRSAVYCITAYGETSEIKKVVRLNVYQTPTIKSLEIPIPTKIELETDISFFATQIPTKTNLQSAFFTQKVPKIDLIKSAILKPPTIAELAKAYKKTPDELVVPLFLEKDTPKNNNPYDSFLHKALNFKKVKTRIFDNLENTFKDNWRASQIISLIRKNYNI